MSDAVLDACLKEDPLSKVACGTKPQRHAALTVDVASMQTATRTAGRRRRDYSAMQSYSSGDDLAPPTARCRWNRLRTLLRAPIRSLSSGFARCCAPSETCTKTGMVMVFGEITSKAKVNYGRHTK